MADAYNDLAALAAKDPAGKGRLWFVRDASAWSYAGCAIEARASNIRVPIESVPDSRVQAALQDGSWVGSVADTSATPITLLAVQKAPDPGVAFRPLTRADLGTAAAA
ncbi:hypothetical protein [Methylobacterium tardum]|uniref:hypothetical protein n=1 Tax=Methylobacterium tardum TaxID=374432 RepID=UPI00202204FD|nr:hypothetical protein [Methylobacterium tardum]URD39298.1 hypothetical protein M6G65_13335 [Methylobacterium tardum]